ncbi:hypothetical protein B0T16DRAFT_411768 [Cercophora newfieldiana]|uniref:Uncharacterized protein n=1 Tax=Cercophora newfieldiana TaxID=92897 RepID=A0AA40CNR3_9PEZI|nr:hypothetical protein B0T16DRAFT_411768 [Cercophora newfieldiana]
MRARVGEHVLSPFELPEMNARRRWSQSHLSRGSLLADQHGRCGYAQQLPWAGRAARCS